MENKEIERKWLVRNFPNDLKLIEESIIYQTYLSTEPEIRISKKEIAPNFDIPKCKMTIKGNGNLTRTEIEFPLTFNQYIELMLEYKLLSSIIFKDCKIYEIDKYKLYVSKVDNLFYYAEVEFDSEEEAKQFDLSRYIKNSCEVTEEPLFKMKQYWTFKQNVGTLEYFMNQVKERI